MTRIEGLRGLLFGAWASLTRSGTVTTAETDLTSKNMPALFPTFNTISCFSVRMIARMDQVEHALP